MRGFKRCYLGGGQVRPLTLMSTSMVTLTKGFANRARRWRWSASRCLSIPPSKVPKFFMMIKEEKNRKTRQLTGWIRSKQEQACLSGEVNIKPNKWARRSARTKTLRWAVFIPAIVWPSYVTETSTLEAIFKFKIKFKFGICSSNFTPWGAVCWLVVRCLLLGNKDVACKPSMI
jgi:hypothetical protein